MLGSLSLLSGALGALGGYLSKLTFSADSIVATWIRTECTKIAVQRHADHVVLGVLPIGKHPVSICDFSEYFVRGTFGLTMFVVNALMISATLSALPTDGSVVSTSLSTAANFCLSAAIGYLLLDETFNILWYAGFSLVVLGVVIILSSSNPTTTTSDDKKRK